MRKTYYDAYRDLYDIYRTTYSNLHLYGIRMPFFNRFFSRTGIRELRIIDDAITRSQADLGLLDRLRPDARFFLLLNVHQMIYLPLQYAKQEQRRTRPRDEITIVEDLIRADVRTILETSIENAKNGEISGHMIIDALSSAWGRLRTTKLEVWG